MTQTVRLKFPHNRSHLELKHAYRLGDPTVERNGDLYSCKIGKLEDEVKTLKDRVAKAEYVITFLHNHLEGFHAVLFLPRYILSAEKELSQLIEHLERRENNLRQLSMDWINWELSLKGIELEAVEVVRDHSKIDQ